MRTKEKIYRSCQSDLLKRVFKVENEDSVVRLNVAEKVLHRALDEAFEKYGENNNDIDTRCELRKPCTP